MLWIFTHIKSRIDSFLRLFKVKLKPRLKIGDVVVSKMDMILLNPSLPPYLIISGVEDGWAKVKIPIFSAMLPDFYYRLDDLTKVELTELERIIYGIE